MLIADQLVIQSSSSRNKIAIQEGTESLTYQKLYDAIGRLSYLFAKEFGIRPVIALIANNSMYWMLSWIAFSNIRARILMIPPTLAPEEIIKLLNLSECNIVCTSEDLLPGFRDSFHRLGFSPRLYNIQNKRAGEYDTHYTTVPSSAPQSQDDILYFLSQGTEHERKFAGFTHDSTFTAILGLKKLYKPVNETFLTFTNFADPFAFQHGVLLPLFSGSTVVFPPVGPDAPPLSKWYASEKVTRLVGTLPDLETALAEEKTFPTIKSFTLGRTNAPPTFHKKATQLKLRILQTYGQVENLWTIAMQSYTEAPSPDADDLGELLVGIKARIANEEKQTVPFAGGQTGELCVQTASLTRGFLNKEIQVPNRVHFTGDRVEVQNNHLYWIGREIEALFVDNSNDQYNRKIEKLLQAFPFVQDNCCFAMKVPNKKSIVVLIVQAKDDVPVSEKDILEFLASKEDKLILPQLVLFMPKIPKDHMGKPLVLKIKHFFDDTVFSAPK